MADDEMTDAHDHPGGAMSEDLRRAYEDGRAAALAGEEAAPGCTTTEAGKAWLQGYVAGATERARIEGD